MNFSKQRNRELLHASVLFLLLGGFPKWAYAALTPAQQTTNDLDVVAHTQYKNGGLLAHTIMNHKNPTELEQWVLEATPETLGPIFMTLISEAKAFDAISDETDPTTGQQTQVKTHYTQSETQTLQQTAINRLLNWMVDDANKKSTPPVSQLQFEEAFMRMNRFGTISKTPGKSYCENRLKMDNFMAIGAQRFFGPGADSVRAEYRQHTAFLGARMDDHCEHREYHGRYYIPGGEARYKGEGL
ncbi:hypothetical protein [Pseudomonas sp. H9]|uniref:hypothetical protein n=1 Tax=Pseudomonas sp. H9 TaxID=483968 RepID=UPI00105829DE|nr:hypothetical protein [Pseudomonas sp. H9]TDF84070.1 hypothetical protein E1573_10040 [Pseudomonas sp. H9]